MSPIFLRENVDSINQICDELEKYWINLGSTKINFARWSSCIITDILLTSITGKRSFATSFYYNSFPNSLLSETPENIIDEPLKFIDSIHTFVSGLLFFLI